MKSPTKKHSRRRLDRTLSDVFGSFALLAGMQLDVFNALAAKPLSCEELARSIGAHEDKLRLLLDVLVAAGFLRANKDKYRNSRLSASFLVSGSDQSAGMSHELLSEVWAASLQAASTVRSGQPAARHDFASMSESQRDRFFQSLDAEARATGRDLLSRFDFTDRTSLVDVGGGSGGVAITIAQACPALRATVIDLPNIVPVSRRFIGAAGFGDRIDVVAHNMTQPMPEDRFRSRFDVAILRAFLQVLGREEARSALRGVGEMVRPGAPIYVVGMGIVDDSRTSPREAVFYNMAFMTLYDAGQAYTESEYRAWLTEAGFEGARRIIRPDGGSIITARKRESA